MAKKSPQHKAGKATSKKAVKTGPKTLHWALAGLLFVVLAFVLYGRTAGYGYVLDDDVVYLKNKHVQAGYDGIGDIMTTSFIHGFTGNNDQSYRPVVLINFAIEREWFRNNSGTQHKIGIFLYGLCGLLVWLLMKRLFRQRHPAIPLLIALLFMVHPTHVEVVANIKGRDDLLHFLFAVGTVLFAVRYVQTEKMSNLVWMTILFILALFSKEMAVTFVAVVPLTLWFFTESKAKQYLLTTAPLLASVVFYLIVRSAVLTDITFDGGMEVINNTLAAADGTGERIATAFFILVQYLKLLFFPHPLSWDYSFGTIPILGLTDWQFLLSLLVLMGLGVVAVWGFLKKDPIAWGILYFFITISVVSNLVILIGATMAERFLFTPSIGFAVAIVLLLARITNSETAATNLFKKPAFIAPILVVAVLFSAKTIAQAGVWKDSPSLFEAGVKGTPNNSRAWNAYAIHFRTEAEKARDAATRTSNYNRAIEYFDKALAILPDNFDAAYNKGVSLQAMGRNEEAIAAYHQCLETNPGYGNANNNIGTILFNGGNPAEAQPYFAAAVETEPSHPDALPNLGLTYYVAGDYETAVIHLENVLRYYPGHKNSAKYLAQSYANLGDSEKAAHYRRIAGN